MEKYNKYIFQKERQTNVFSEGNVLRDKVSKGLMSNPWTGPADRAHVGVVRVLLAGWVTAAHRSDIS